MFDRPIRKVVEYWCVLMRLSGRGKMDSSDAVVILEHMLTWLEKGKMFPHETAETFSGKGTEYRDRYYALYCEALKAAIQAMKNQD